MGRLTRLGSFFAGAVVLLLLALHAPSAGAQEPSAPAEEPAEEPAEVPDAEEASLARLREIEARLSVGQSLTDDERALLARLAAEGETPRVRALAAAILPWLPADEAAPPLLAALDDEDPRVRDQALEGLIAAARRVEGELREQLLAAALRRLDDPSDEVACSAGRLVAVLDRSRLEAAVGERADEVGDVRHECWRRLTPLDPREITTPPPPSLAPPPEPEPEPAPEPAAPLAAPGDVLFVATAASAGFLVGGLVPGIFLPPRDALLYTPRRSAFTREEPSILFAGTTAAAGSLLLGGAALTATLLLPPLELPAAASTVMGAAGGAFAGLGGALAFGQDDATTGALVVGGALGGLVLTSALAHTLPPSGSDVGFAAALGGQAALAGTLLSLTAVPVGNPVLFDRVRREDFAIGTGLLAGGALGVGGLVLSPVFEFSSGRVLAASAAGLAGAGLGLGVGYLFTPANVTIRERIASGLAVGMQLVAGTVVFVLLPSEWADAIGGSSDVVGPSALYFDEGELRLGAPTVSWLPPAPGQVSPAVAVELLSGRF